MVIDLTKIKRIHFVGIKGIAMAALAVYAKERGYKITGSDVAEEFPSDEVLRKAKISVMTGFDAVNIKKVKPDFIIYTGAHGGRDNEEVHKGEELSIPVLAHGRALGMFMNGKRQISVAGSHGKTTTTAMIATILNHVGFDPSYAIGSGEIRGLGASGHFGRGDWFIAEADEYATDPQYDKTPRFLWQNPELLVVTNIDYDHPDVYRSLEEVTHAFTRLRDKVQSRGEVIITDDPSCNAMRQPVTIVGRSARADYQVTGVHFSEERTFFTLEMPGVTISEFIIKVPGKHNAVNAALAAVTSHDAGISWDDIHKGLYEFGGVKRRFEKIGEAPPRGLCPAGVLFYDDYAHHPKEIAATLAGIREWFPKRRIIAVFQPHTYSRTKALMSDFAKAFTKSDSVIITDIYASAREHETMGITGQSLVRETIHHHRDVHYAKDAGAVSETLEKILTPNDLVIFMGAGDIYVWEKEVIKNLWKKN